jgi:hypothetical protein
MTEKQKEWLLMMKIGQVVEFKKEIEKPKEDWKLIFWQIIHIDSFNNGI